jgi:transcription elongation factor GreA
MELITAEEKRQLEEKLAQLKARRPEITQRIAEARELGDLKENAEYHAARDEQGWNEDEIRRLEERLKNAQVAEEAEVPEDMVFLGSTVRLRDLKTGKEEHYKLVGEASGNFDAEVLEVTPDSPLGASLMKARIGEQIRVDLPRKTRRFEIVEIQ